MDVTSQQRRSRLHIVLLICCVALLAVLLAFVPFLFAWVITSGFFFTYRWGFDPSLVQRLLKMMSGIDDTYTVVECARSLVGVIL